MLYYITMASIIQSINTNPTTSSITLTFTTDNVNQYYYFIYYYLTTFFIV